MSIEKKIYYGTRPQLLGNFPIRVKESFFYLYLPIKMARSGEINLPRRLDIFQPLVNAAVVSIPTQKEFEDKYLYLTAKNMFVTPSFWGNRPGWHADGFLTDDRNWIWCDRNPTVFNESKFDITPSHTASILEFEMQAKEENSFTFRPCDLLQLDPFVVHRVAAVTEPGMRCFVKISMSDHRYNLIGNSHNYLLDYRWRMHQRSEVRNEPSFDALNNSDYVPPEQTV